MGDRAMVSDLPRLAKMLGLCNDLLVLIATYTVLDPTLILLTLSPEGARKAYERWGKIWRDKARYETLGVTLSEELVVDWLLHYQMVRRQFYGDAVLPFPDGLSPEVTARGVTHLLAKAGYVVYVTENRVMHWYSNGVWLDALNLPRRPIAISWYGNSVCDVSVLLETGQIIRVDHADSGVLKVFRYFPNSPERFVAIVGRSGEVWYLTRDGVAGVTSRYPSLVHPGMVSLVPFGGERFSQSYIDQIGIPQVFPDETGETPIGIHHSLTRVVHIVPDRNCITLFGDFLTDRDATGNYLDFDPSGTRYISIFQRMTGDNRAGVLITSARQIRLFDPKYPGVLTMPVYDAHTGRIETWVGGYLLVAPRGEPENEPGIDPGTLLQSS